MQSPFYGEISAHFKTKAPDTARQTIDGETKGVAPAVDYCHFEGREDLIAETALQGYCIFADLMEHAFRDGQPSAITAFEATGRARSNFLRVHPGHYISMFESDISANRTTELSHTSQRAHNIMERASQDLRPTCTWISAPLHPCSASTFRPCRIVLSDYSHMILHVHKARLSPKIC